MLQQESGRLERSEQEYQRSSDNPITLLSLLQAIKAMEKDLISLYGRRDIGTGTLVNLNDGGYGGLSGYEHTYDHKAFMSKRMSGENHPCHDPEIYTFYNYITKETLRAKRVEMKKLYPGINFDSIFSTSNKTNRGWLVIENNTEREIEEITLGIKDKRLWRFYNRVDKTVTTTTQAEFRLANPERSIENLMSGKNSGDWIVLDLVDQERVVAFENRFKGIHAGCADKSKYNFYNIENGTSIHCTRQEFKDIVGFDPKALFQTTKKILRHGMWCLAENKEVVTFNFDRKIYHFVHKDGTEFKGTRVDFKKKFGVDVKWLFGNNEKLQHLGWTLYQNKDVAFVKKSDRTHYKFIHKSGDVFSGSRTSFEEKYGISPKPLFRTNPPKSCLGWTLE